MLESTVALKGNMQSPPESFSVPRTYPELQARYGSHIEKLLLRHNQYPANFEDLHSYVWVKLLEARLLERFLEYVDRQGPKVLTSTQVCDFLGVSWQEWVAACSASHTGPRKTWMPTPVNLAQFEIQGDPWYDDASALFSFGDIVRLTCAEEVDGVEPWVFERWGCDVREGIVLGDSRPEGHLKYPLYCPTASLFKNYLNRTVLNSYANFCRTLKRRHKERPQSPQGNEGHMTSWEDTLVEHKQPSMEVKLQVSEARAILKTAIQSGLNDFGVPCGGDEETKIFALLEQGASLIQALKACGFPNKVRQSVIKSIQVTSEAALEEMD